MRQGEKICAQAFGIHGYKLQVRRSRFKGRRGLSVRKIVAQRV
jgi:hypothetical protein